MSEDYGLIVSKLNEEPSKKPVVQNPAQQSYYETTIWNDLGIVGSCKAQDYVFDNWGHLKDSFTNSIDRNIWATYKGKNIYQTAQNAYPEIMAKQKADELLHQLEKLITSDKKLGKIADEAERIRLKELNDGLKPIIEKLRAKTVAASGTTPTAGGTTTNPIYRYRKNYYKDLLKSTENALKKLGGSYSEIQSLVERFDFNPENPPKLYRKSPTKPSEAEVTARNAAKKISDNALNMELQAKSKIESLITEFEKKLPLKTDYDQAVSRIESAKLSGGIPNADDVTLKNKYDFLTKQIEDLKKVSGTDYIPGNYLKGLSKEANYLKATGLSDLVKDVDISKNSEAFKEITRLAKQDLLALDKQLRNLIRTTSDSGVKAEAQYIINQIKSVKGDPIEALSKARSLLEKSVVSDVKALNTATKEIAKGAAKSGLGKVFGKIFGPLAILGLEYYEETDKIEAAGNATNDSKRNQEFREDQTHHSVVNAVGATAGCIAATAATAGTITAISTAVGTAVCPIVGTAVGFLVGCIIGGIGAWAGKKATESLQGKSKFQEYLDDLKKAEKMTETTKDNLKQIIEWQNDGITSGVAIDSLKRAVEDSIGQKIDYEKLAKEYNEAKQKQGQTSQ